MTEHTHSEFFSTPPIESLPDDIRARLEDIQERSGFCPTFLLRWPGGQMSFVPSSIITMC